MSNEMAITNTVSQPPVHGQNPAAEAAKPQAQAQEVRKQAAEQVEQAAEVRESIAVDAETLRDAIDQLNEIAKSQARELQFAVDDGTGQVVVKVIESTTQNLVRQIPSEEFLRLAERMQSGDNGGLMEVAV